MEEYKNINTKQFRGSGFMTVSKYNNSGDILYVADKDSKNITAIETIGYNVIGSFDKHNGVIWSLDLSSDDSVLISCSGDLSICFWKSNNGKLIHHFVEKCIPKYISTQKKMLTNLVGIICEKISKKSMTYILIYDLEQITENNFTEKIKILWNKTCKPTVLTWLNENVLIIGCDDGKIILKNINDNDDTKDIEYQIHNSTIKSIVWNNTKTEILTGSLDCTAKQIDIKTWKIKATYNSTVPINYACWNHNDRKVFIGGGIEAMNISKTSNNDLNLKIYRTVDQKLTNQMSSHFGPIRYIDKSPCNKNFVTASQDGTVKIYFIIDDDFNEKKNKTIDNSNTNLLENFGSCVKYQLTNEINKLENLNWKPVFKPKNEKKINWIPGMNQIEENNSILNLSCQNGNKKNSELYDISSCKDLTNDQLYQINKDQDNQNCTIRVTNLPPDIQSRDLADLFDFYGRIALRDGIKIKKYEDTTMAFIKYTFPESATKAINNLDQTAINHYIIKIEYAKKK